MTAIPNLRYVFDGSNFIAPGRPFLPGPAVVPVTGTNRDALILGSYIPGMTVDTVGLSDPNATWTDVFGDSTGYIYIDSVATAGDTVTNPIRDTRYWGKVKVRTTADAYFANCQFYNRLPEDMYAASVGSNGGCIENFGAAPPLVHLTDCLLDPKAWFDAGISAYWGHPVQVGIHGGNFIAKRTEFRNCQDGINYVGPNTDVSADAAQCLVQACWIHKNFYLKPWTGPGSPASQDTHSDAFQFNTGKNITIEYNLLGGQFDPVGYNASPAYNSGDDCHNSGIMIQQEVSLANSNLVSNVLIQNNWLAGGAATVNANLKNGNTGADWVCQNNKIARRGTTEWAGPGYSIYRNGGLAMSFTGNVIWDWNGAIDGTGVPAPIVNYPGT